MADLRTVARVCTFWHFAFSRKLDQLREAHTSFQLEAMKEGGSFVVAECEGPQMPAPLFQGLGRAWDIICAYLSNPNHHSLQCWVDDEGHVVGVSHWPFGDDYVL